jgi:hypothetical protein
VLIMDLKEHLELWVGLLAELLEKALLDFF